MERYDFVSLLPSVRPLRLLDIGCGTCTEGEQLVESGIDLTGIDQDGVTLAAVRARLPQGTFLTMNAADFDAKESFDVILLRRPDLVLGARTWQRIFGRLAQWLTPTGLVVVTTPGQVEAKLAQRWLHESGAQKVVMTMTDHEDERYLLQVSELAEAQADEGQPTTMISNLRWSEDDEPVLACDLKTGTCSPA